MPAFGISRTKRESGEAPLASNAGDGGAGEGSAATGSEREAASVASPSGPGGTRAHHARRASCGDSTSFNASSSSLAEDEGCLRSSSSKRHSHSHSTHTVSATSSKKLFSPPDDTRFDPLREWLAKSLEVDWASLRLSSTHGSDSVAASRSRSTVATSGASASEADTEEMDADSSAATSAAPSSEQGHGGVASGSKQAEVGGATRRSKGRRLDISDLAPYLGRNGLDVEKGFIIVDGPGVRRTSGGPGSGRTGSSKTRRRGADPQAADDLELLDEARAGSAAANGGYWGQPRTRSNSTPSFSPSRLTVFLPALEDDEQASESDEEEEEGDEIDLDLGLDLGAEREESRGAGLEEKNQKQQAQRGPSLSIRRESTDQQHQQKSSLGTDAMDMVPPAGEDLDSATTPRPSHGLTDDELLPPHHRDHLSPLTTVSASAAAATVPSAMGATSKQASAGGAATPRREDASTPKGHAATIGNETVADASIGSKAEDSGSDGGGSRGLSTSSNIALMRDSPRRYARGGREEGTSFDKTPLSFLTTNKAAEAEDAELAETLPGPPYRKGRAAARAAEGAAVGETVARRIRGGEKGRGRAFVELEFTFSGARLAHLI